MVGDGGSIISNFCHDKNFLYEDEILIYCYTHIVVRSMSYKMDIFYMAYSSKLFML